jgi:hypothetical protein
MWVDQKEYKMGNTQHSSIERVIVNVIGTQAKMKGCTIDSPPSRPWNMSGYATHKIHGSKPFSITIREKEMSGVLKGTLVVDNLHVKHNEKKEETVIGTFGAYLVKMTFTFTINSLVSVDVEISEV